MENFYDSDIYFRKGTTVYHPVYGKGIITKVYRGFLYVRFEKHYFVQDVFKLDGRRFEDGPIILSHKPFKEVKNKKLKPLKIGEKVWVSDDGKKWVLRYFWFQRGENTYHCCPSCNFDFETVVEYNYLRQLKK